MIRPLEQIPRRRGGAKSHRMRCDHGYSTWNEPKRTLATALCGTCSATRASRTRQVATLRRVGWPSANLRNPRTGSRRATKNPKPGLFANSDNQKGRIVGAMAAAEFGNGIDYFLL